MAGIGQQAQQRRGALVVWYVFYGLPKRRRLHIVNAARGRRRRRCRHAMRQLHKLRTLLDRTRARDHNNSSACGAVCVSVFSPYLRIRTSGVLPRCMDVDERWLALWIVHINRAWKQRMNGTEFSGNNTNLTGTENHIYYSSIQQTRTRLLIYVAHDARMRTHWIAINKQNYFTLAKPANDDDDRVSISMYLQSAQTSRRRERSKYMWQDDGTSGAHAILLFCVRV